MVRSFFLGQDLPLVEVEHVGDGWLEEGMPQRRSISSAKNWRLVRVSPCARSPLLRASMAEPRGEKSDTMGLRATCASKFASSSANTPMKALRLMLSSVSSMSKTTALRVAMGAVSLLVMSACLPIMPKPRQFRRTNRQKPSEALVVARVAQGGGVRPSPPLPGRFAAKDEKIALYA